MLDIKLIRENPEIVKKSNKDRGYDINVDELLKLDEQWRKSKFQEDKIRNERNKISEEINKAKKNKDDKKAKELIKKAKEIPEKLKKQQETTEEIRKKIDEVQFRIPNIPDKSVPVGDESKNKVIKKSGKIPKFSFPVKNHVELLGELLDIKRSTKIAGAGFYIFEGELAKLERALIQFFLDFHVKEGFTEINPPQIVNEKTMFGTGNLPKFEDDLYKTREGFYLIPTAEVPVTNLFAEEVLSEEELPKKFCSFTQCYRTEAGRHGSETPGIFRLHEFEKVEMVYISKPEDSWKFLEEMTERAEKIIEMIELPYRRILLATGDMTFATAKTYDIEVWSPSLKKYLETSSCSNCTDFQARRMNCKYTEKGTNERKFVHTLNGSGLATPRLLISLIENNQTKTGSIKIPKVLWKYTGFKEIKAKKAEKGKTAKG